MLAIKSMCVLVRLRKKKNDCFPFFPQQCNSPPIYWSLKWEKYSGCSDKFESDSTCDFAEMSAEIYDLIRQMRKNSERMRSVIQQPVKVFIFQRANKSLNDGDAAMFANRPIAGLYRFSFTPSLETFVPELNAFVADEVFWRCARRCDAAADELANIDQRIMRHRHQRYHRPFGILLPTLG